MVVLQQNMVKASRRKTNCPRKILRVQHDDGRCELQPQENGLKDDQCMDYEDGTIPSPTSPTRVECSTDFYERYDKMYNSSAQMKGSDYAGEYLKEATKVFLNSLQKTDYVIVQPSYEAPEAQDLLTDTTNKEPPMRIKTYNGVKKHSHFLSKDKHRHPEPTPEYPYQCETCDMLFKSIELLSDHQKTLHENNRQFACRYCSKRFNDKYNMRKHVLIHVGEKRHKCQFCDKAFLRKDHLRSHLQTHYNRKYGCKICGKSFRTIELYQRHARTHKNVDHLSEMSNLENLQPELENSSRNGSPISHAGEPTSVQTPIKQEEMRSGSNPGSVYEDSYAEQSNSPWNRSGSPTFSDISGESGPHSSPRGGDHGHSHENGEANNKTLLNFKCSYCNLACEDQSSLNVHELKCRSETQKWQCIKCNIIFDEPATLKHHYEKMHSNEKPAQSPSRWRCKTCDINYPNSKELSRHYAHAHKDAQIFPCSECPKTFTVWHNLKKHMLIHLGDKKHKCNICQKGFVRKDHLNSHMKVHMGDGSKYTCPICRKVFRLKQMYFKHMNLHGLEQAYIETDSMEPPRSNGEYQNGRPTEYQPKQEQSYVISAM